MSGWLATTGHARQDREAGGRQQMPEALCTAAVQGLVPSDVSMAAVSG